MTSGASPYVDYDAIAARYAVGRAMGAEALAPWRAAVAPYLPETVALVADVGSGTGVFARAWTAWTPARVVGVEPSSAMLREAAASTDPRVAYVRGVAEALPLADRCVDVAWLSTTFHHFADQRLAARELGRVLRDGGRVLVRGGVRGLTPPSWLAVFPGRERPLARYPTREHLERVFGDAGLHLLAATNVEETGRTNRELADWVERMRDADTILGALTDDEIAAGVQALRQRPDETMPFALTLVVFG